MIAAVEKTITFREREFKGSRFRCLLLTSQEEPIVANFLTSLVKPYASVSSEDYWTPRGFRQPEEAKLGETPGFLDETDRKVITDWWLAAPGRANTPNWDLVSKCRMADRKGLILVEAKAHEGEFSNDQCGAKNQQNFQQIEKALSQANDAWNSLSSGFALSASSYYQLSNRFAFAWKVAEMGTPVVLVYLGFLNAHEMAKPSTVLLNSHDAWRNCVISKSARVVPQDVWDKTFDVNGTPLTVLIRSAEVTISSMTKNSGE